MYGFCHVLSCFVTFDEYSHCEAAPNSLKASPSMCLRIEHIKPVLRYSWDLRNPETFKPGYIWFFWNHLKALARCATLRIDEVYARIRHWSFSSNPRSSTSQSMGICTCNLLCWSASYLWLQKSQRSLWRQQLRLCVLRVLPSACYYNVARNQGFEVLASLPGMEYESWFCLACACPDFNAVLQDDTHFSGEHKMGRTGFAFDCAGFTWIGQTY